MTEKIQSDLGRPHAVGNRCAVRHPAWCDHSHCTADPASQANGYRAGLGGQHRSASVRLDLTCAMWLPAQAGEAYLTQAVAPWTCSTYLHVRAGDAEVAISVSDAAPVLAALYGLLMTAEAAQEVTRP
jgi:hypothetical protein